jgi:hypothetical protein
MGTLAMGYLTSTRINYFSVVLFQMFVLVINANYDRVVIGFVTSPKNGLTPVVGMEKLLRRLCQSGVNLAPTGT